MLHNHMAQLFWSYLVIAAKYNESQTNSAFRASIHCALCPDPSSLLTVLSDSNINLERPLNEFPQQEMLLPVPENEQSRILHSCTADSVFRVSAF